MKRRSMYFIISGTCIQSVNRNSTEATILNNMNESICVRINGKKSDRDLAITKLQINKTCVTAADVSVVDANLQFNRLLLSDLQLVILDIK